MRAAAYWAAIAWLLLVGGLYLIELVHAAHG